MRFGAAAFGNDNSKSQCLNHGSFLSIQWKSQGRVNLAGASIWWTGVITIAPQKTGRGPVKPAPEREKLLPGGPITTLRTPFSMYSSSALWAIHGSGEGCVCSCLGCYSENVEVRLNFVELLLSCHLYVGFRDWTWASGVSIIVPFTYPYTLWRTLMYVVIGYDNC